MYRCRMCSEVSQPGVTLQRIVLERQQVQHRARSKAYPNGHDDPGGVGTQIVREMAVCSSCALKHTIG